MTSLCCRCNLTWVSNACKADSKVLLIIYNYVKRPYSKFVNYYCVSSTNILFLGLQQTQQISRSTFHISFHLDWQIDIGIFNRLLKHGGTLVGARNKDFGAVSQMNLTRVWFCLYFLDWFIHFPQTTHVFLVEQGIAV